MMSSDSLERMHYRPQSRFEVLRTCHCHFWFYGEISLTFQQLRNVGANQDSRCWCPCNSSGIPRSISTCNLDTTQFHWRISLFRFPPIRLWFVICSFFDVAVVWFAGCLVAQKEHAQVVCYLMRLFYLFLVQIYLFSIFHCFTEIVQIEFVFKLKKQFYFF